MNDGNGDDDGGVGAAFPDYYYAWVCYSFHTLKLRLQKLPPKKCTKVVRHVRNLDSGQIF
jgi:hypothetical protein